MIAANRKYLRCAHFQVEETWVFRLIQITPDMYNQATCTSSQINSGVDISESNKIRLYLGYLLGYFLFTCRVFRD